MPDVMHDFASDFVARHRDKPFCLYYSRWHVHAEILPTPDSSPGSKDLYGDNTRYMDKLVGKMVGDLDRLKLRENTVIVFVGDNGTGNGYAERSTVRGRRISGEKGSMLEGGALVPLIVNWKGATPVGKVIPALTDSTDFLPTFAELAGAPMPAGKVIDGRSLVPQWRGQQAAQRDWVYIQLARQWYVRDAKWKLNQKGDLFDMSHAPFEEPVAGSNSKEAAAARAKLQAHWRNSTRRAGLWMKAMAPDATRVGLIKNSPERAVRPSRPQNAFQRLNKEVVPPDGALVDAQAPMHVIQAALKDALPTSRLLAQILVA